MPGRLYTDRRFLDPSTSLTPARFNRSALVQSLENLIGRAHAWIAYADRL